MRTTSFPERVATITDKPLTITKRFDYFDHFDPSGPRGEIERSLRTIPRRPESGKKPRRTTIEGVVFRERVNEGFD